MLTEFISDHITTRKVITKNIIQLSAKVAQSMRLHKVNE
jgi:hypothetical protein